MKKLMIKEFIKEDKKIMINTTMINHKKKRFFSREQEIVFLMILTPKYTSFSIILSKEEMLYKQNKYKWNSLFLSKQISKNKSNNRL